MKFNINFHIFLRAGRYQTRHAIFTRSSTHLRFILVFDFRFHIPRVKIRWYRRSVFLYERRKRGGGETCLFPIREITTGSGNNPPGWYGLTSILTRVKARPWHHANTATHTHTTHSRLLSPFSFMHLEILIAPLVIRGKRFPFTETIHLSNEKRNSSDPRIRIFQDF